MKCILDTCPGYILRRPSQQREMPWMRCISSHLKGESAIARSRGLVWLWSCSCSRLEPTPRRTSPELLLTLSTSNPHDDALLCLTSNDRFDLGFLNHCSVLIFLLLAYRSIAIKPCARSSEYLRNIVVLYIQRSS